MTRVRYLADLFKRYRTACDKRREQTPPVAVAPDDQVTQLRGPALKIAENMAASLTVPTATSQRAMPVKVIDENRRSINQYRSTAGKSKLSYTHLVAWSIVRALDQVPALNQAYSTTGGDSFRITRGHVNLGLAVVVNDGYLPSASAMGRRTRAVRPVRIALDLPKEAVVLAGERQTLVRELAGSGGRSEHTWLVRGVPPSAMRVLLDTDHAGRASVVPEVK
jgi:hypothetical protein